MRKWISRLIKYGPIVYSVVKKIKKQRQSHSMKK